MSIEAATSARDQFLEALREGDAASLESLVDERFTFTDARGRVLIDREGLVEFVRGGRLRFARIELVEDSPRLQKDGTVRFHSLLDLDGSLDGVRYQGRYRVIDVFSESVDGWVAALSAASLTG